MKTLKIIIEKSVDSYGAYADNFVGINGAGDSVAAVKESVQSCIRIMEEFHPELKDSKLVYQYDTQSFLNYYSKIFSMPALEKLTGINQKQLHHYAMGKSKPRKTTKHKIEKAMHLLGQELIALQL